MFIGNAVGRGFDSFMRWVFGAKIASGRQIELMSAQREIARLKREKGFR